MIGYSLSFCVQDVLSGKIEEDDIVMIETGTKLVTHEEWETMLCVYGASYWSANPEKARKIVARLRDTGRIYQPRLFGEAITSLFEGHWSTSVVLGKDLVYVE